MDTKIVSCCVTDAPVCTSVPSPPLSCHPCCLASRLRTTSTPLSVFRGECPSQRIKWHSISQEIFQHLPTFRLLDTRSRCSLSVHSKYFEVAPRQERYDIMLFIIPAGGNTASLHLLTPESEDIWRRRNCSRCSWRPETAFTLLRLQILPSSQG